MSPLRQARGRSAQALVAEAVRSEGPDVGKGAAERDGAAMIKKLKVRRVNSIRGLMFRRKPTIPVLLKIPDGRFFKGNYVHTWFVFYPIDAAFIDQNKNVIGISRLKPFSGCRLPKQTYYIVEAPAGKLGTSVGDVVEFEEAGE